MNITSYQEQSGHAGYETACPYGGVDICMASFSSMVIDNHKRKNCCRTDNYDDCPIFLSKLLRKG